MHMDQPDEDMCQYGLDQLINFEYTFSGINFDDMSGLQTHYQMPEPDLTVSEMPPPGTLVFPQPLNPVVAPASVMPPAPLNQGGHCLDGNPTYMTMADFMKSEIVDMSGLDDAPPSQTVTPCTEPLEPVTPVQLPVTLTAVQGTRLDADRPPKRHRLQIPQVTDGPDSRLVSLLSTSDFKYKGYIASADEAKALRTRYDRLSCQEGRNTSFPGQDESFPNNNVEFRRRVREIFEAICDWTDLREWRAKMGQKRVKDWLAEVAQQRRNKGLDDDLSKLSDKDLMPPADRMPKMEEQWKNVIHRPMSDIEIELLCAQILDQAMAAQMGLNERILNAFRDNKVLIHSAIRAPWITRITNSPHSETRRKYQNKAGNDRKRTLIEQGGSEKKKAKAESMSPF
ncbi:hypothetical protein ACHAPT_004682 [Fusarium lateritium]